MNKQSFMVRDAIHKKLRIALLFDEIGPNANGIGAGPRIGAASMVRALAAHSVHHCEFFCMNDISDDDISHQVNRIKFDKDGEADLLARLSKCDLIQVVNGKWLAIKAHSLGLNPVLGPNVVFSLPYRFPGKPSEYALTRGDIMHYEEQICSLHWPAVVMPNHDLTSLFKTRFSEEKLNTISWAYGIDDKRFFDIGLPRDRIVWIGSSHPDKGGALASKVRELLPDLDWVFLGDEVPFRYGEHVSVLQRAKLVLITSKSETQGIAALEAVMAGAPTIVCKHYMDVAGKSRSFRPPYIYDGENAIVVGRDPSQIAQTVERLLSDEKGLREFAHTAFRFVQKHFSLAASAKSYDSAMRRVWFEKQTGSRLADVVERHIARSEAEEALEAAKFLIEGEPFSVLNRTIYLQLLDELKDFGDDFDDQMAWVERLTRGSTKTSP